MSTESPLENVLPSRAARRFGVLLSSGLALSFCLFLVACGSTSHDHDDHEPGDPGHDDHGDHEHGAEAESTGGESWAITAWGSSFEIFPEIDALVAGAPASAHVHVTRLEDFAPVTEGAVEIVLRGSSGEEVFRSETLSSETPARPGIFNVEITPSTTGEFDLAFRVETPGAEEELRGGRVRVGTSERPGGLLVAPAPKGGSGGEPIPFLKEEQWRSPFATSWVRRGELARSVEGLVRVRPPAGGETLLSSPLAGIVSAAGSWPFPGQRITRGSSLFRVAPQVAVERSLADLEATAASLEIEKTAVEERLARLEELLDLEATSRREVEEVRHHAQILEARHVAALRDLEAARAARRGGSGSGALELEAPFDGEVAEVATTPGATVAAGEVLARLVRTDVVWLETALQPADARKLAPGKTAVRGLVLTPPGRGAPVHLDRDVRLVAVAPEASATTGKVTAYFEAGVETQGEGRAAETIVLGTTLDGLVLLDETREGIVVPASALVDDGGVSVVYLQLSGESFLRQEIEILERQGDRVLVDGLEPGQRLVHRGGDAIRRSSLMSSGEAHGHVH